MEIKDYSEIASKIEKANALINDSEKAKQKDVESVIGNIKSKMESWLNHTCGAVAQMMPTKYENNIECTKYTTLKYGCNPTDYLCVCCTFRSWHNLEIAISEEYRGNITSRYGLFYTIESGKLRCVRPDGFRSSDDNGIYVSYRCDEITMKHITTMWPDIKTVVENFMDKIMEQAKEKIISNAADIKATLELIESMKDFEA